MSTYHAGLNNVENKYDDNMQLYKIPYQIGRITHSKEGIKRGKDGRIEWEMEINHSYIVPRRGKAAKQTTRHRGIKSGRDGGGTCGGPRKARSGSCCKSEVPSIELHGERDPIIGIFSIIIIDLKQFTICWSRSHGLDLPCPLHVPLQLFLLPPQLRALRPWRSVVLVCLPSPFPAVEIIVGAWALEALVPFLFPLSLSRLILRSTNLSPPPPKSALAHDPRQ